MERTPRDPSAADAPGEPGDDATAPADEVAEQARREFEEDPSRNPPDERLGDIRGS